MHATRPASRRRIIALSLVLLAAGMPLAAQRSPAPQRTQVRADDGHLLTLWSKRPHGRAHGAVLLLHGRTWSSLPNFDLQVPGQHVSLMDALVSRGWAVYALDQRGYGATPRDTSGWITPTRAASDALEVLDWIAAHEKGSGRPALFGYSLGSMTAMLAAQRDSARLSAVVLYGFPMDVLAMRRSAATAAPDTLPAASPARPERARTTIAGAEEDFITPQSTPPGVKEAYARAAVAADPVRSDWRGDREFMALDPAALHVPVLVINGERDPGASRANLQQLVAAVTGVDRSWVVLSAADHVAHLERQGAFADAIVAFLEQRRAP